MNIKVFNENELVLEFKVRKNARNIIDKIKEKLQEKYNCNIRRALPTGKIDLATGLYNIKYILFGDDLPFKEFRYVKECN